MSDARDRVRAYLDALDERLPNLGDDASLDAVYAHQLDGPVNLILGDIRELVERAERSS